MRSLVTVLMLVGVGSRYCMAQDQWARADLAVRRLAPSAFPSLPPAIRGELEARHCTIPQVYSDPRAGNVISGHFRRPGQRDWAVLCSIQRVSRIIIFWSGRVRGATELAKSADRAYLQGTGHGGIGYSRAIAVVGADGLHGGSEEGDPPGPIDHEGIDDAFVEKASVIWYLARGHWYRLVGDD